ncbi:MAG: hypothetical protein ABFS46_13770 [Myxococcota bacterium]
MAYDSRSELRRALDHLGGGLRALFGLERPDAELVDELLRGRPAGRRAQHKAPRGRRKRSPKGLLVRVK